MVHGNSLPPAGLRHGDTDVPHMDRRHAQATKRYTTAAQTLFFKGEGGIFKIPLPLHGIDKGPRAGLGWPSIRPIPREDWCPSPEHNKGGLSVPHEQTFRSDCGPCPAPSGAGGGSEQGRLDEKPMLCVFKAKGEAAQSI